MIWETFLLALKTIWRNKLRSALTILGIVIGVAAVISMVTLGSGATQKVTEDISKLGTNVLHVRPGHLPQPKLVHIREWYDQCFFRCQRLGSR